MAGHIQLTVTKPTGGAEIPNDVLNQDRWALPGNGWTVQFEPFTLNTEGDYQVEAVLTSCGQTLDMKTVTAAKVTPLLRISQVTITPTQLTSAVHEYETSLGLGYWGDPFTISITFSNPFDYDVWVKPDYAFGHLTGESLGFVSGALQGFNAEELIYFRLLLQSEYIEGDYSYTSDWQKLYDARGQNVSSGLAFVYDPDGVPRMGDERWLKVPAGGSITTVKEAHLGGDLQVRALQCTTCGEIIEGWPSTTAVEQHYADNHPGLEITCWSWGGLSGCYFNDGSGEAVTTVYVPAGGVVGVHDVCAVAWRAIYFVYDPGCGQTRVGGQIVTLNWRLEELAPTVIAIPSAIEIVPA